MSQPNSEITETQYDASRRRVWSQALLLVAGGLFYALIRLRGLTASCLWFDEIFSVHATRHTWEGLLAFAAEDIVHPPLFYLLLKIWIAIGGESLVWLRLFPVLASVIALAPFVLLCRSLKLSTPVINTAVWLMAVSAYLIKYAQTLRMYSLLMLFGLTSLWLFQRQMSAARASHIRFDWPLFAVNLLLIYTHYYGWMVIAVEVLCLALFARKQRRQRLAMFALHLAGLIVCFTPWAWAVIEAITRQQRGLHQNIGWAPRPALRDAANFFLALHEIPRFRWNVATGLVLFLLPLAALLLKRLLERLRGQSLPIEETERDAMWWLVSAVCLPVVTAFLLSRILPQSIWGVRHLIFVAPLYFALIAQGLLSIPPRVAWLRTAALLVLSCWLLAAGAAQLLHQPENYVWCAWEPLTDEVVKTITPIEAKERTRIFVFEDLVAYHIWFALENAAETDRFQVISVKNFPELREDAAYFLPRLFDEVAVATDGPEALKGTYFWVAFRDSDWNERRAPLRTLIERGYMIERRFAINTAQGTAYLIEARQSAF